jgi:hypothetical protein
LAGFFVRCVFCCLEIRGDWFLFFIITSGEKYLLYIIIACKDLAFRQDRLALQASLISAIPQPVVERMKISLKRVTDV